MELSSAKRRHLVSAYATVTHMLRQMEEAADEGRSPTGVGAPLSPLPRAQSDPILEPLRRLRDRLRQLAGDLAPDELAELEHMQSPHNTLVWLSNLLDHVRIAVDDLQPRRVRKYGEVSPSEAAALEAVHHELTQYIRASRERLERCW